MTKLEWKVLKSCKHTKPSLSNHFAWTYMDNIFLTYLQGLEILQPHKTFHKFCINLLEQIWVKYFWPMREVLKSCKCTKPSCIKSFCLNKQRQNMFGISARSWNPAHAKMHKNFKTFMHQIRLFEQTWANYVCHICRLETSNITSKF